MMNGESPISDALISKIEVQKHLQDQLEVQKKLQRHIEAQGRYLQAILDRAQRTLSIDMNCPHNFEATKSRITDFSWVLSNFMDNINGEEGTNGSIIDKSITNDISIIPSSSCLGHEQGDGDEDEDEDDEQEVVEEEELEEEEKEEEDVKIKFEGASINFDLNQH